MLKPFFTFYGGKYRLAPRYPAPLHDTIIEPFAGSAGYALRYPDRRVILHDVDPIVCGVWSYLIRTAAEEIRALPITPIDDVQTLSVPQEARWLIGFWLNKGASSPRRRPSAWMRAGIRPNSFWGEVVRERIAAQVGAIRHWKIVHDSWSACEDIEATWFVDPPYEKAGKHYRRADIDYPALGEWCRSRRGQVIACENEGASWLPFVPFWDMKANESKSGGKVSHEVIWTNDQDK